MVVRLEIDSMAWKLMRKAIRTELCKVMEIRMNLKSHLRYYYNQRKSDYFLQYMGTVEVYKRNWSQQTRRSQAVAIAIVLKTISLKKKVKCRKQNQNPWEQWHSKQHGMNVNLPINRETETQTIHSKLHVSEMKKKNYRAPL